MDRHAPVNSLPPRCGPPFRRTTTCGLPGRLFAMTGVLVAAFCSAATAVADDVSAFRSSRDHASSTRRATHEASSVTETCQDGSVRPGFSVLKTHRERHLQSDGWQFFQTVSDVATPLDPARAALPAQPPTEERPLLAQDGSADFAPPALSATAAPGQVPFRGTVRYIMPYPDTAASNPTVAPTAEPADTAADPPATPDNPDQVERDDPPFIDKPIGTVGVDVQPELPKPEDRETDLATRTATTDMMLEKHGAVRYGIMPYQPVASPAPALASSEFCHLPTYFDDARLERYGQTVGIWQPVLSGAKFFAAVPLLPYKAVVERPRTCYQYKYQHEAGRRAPLYHNRYPIRLDAAVVETLAAMAVVAALL